MKINKINGDCIFEYECSSIKECLLEAVNKKIDLSDANLRWADLRGANLSDADLRGADLRDADLRGANLSDADLRGANLRWADLRWANLRDADLRGANLSGANLRWADLSGADLRWANLRGADLSGANLEKTKLLHFQICPEEGDFIGWKKVIGGDVIKLLIPKKAKRTSSLIGRKCRAEFVKVLDGSGVSCRGGEFKEGKITRPDSYDDDVRVECTHGIHFFITKKEAEEW